ncbi:hypothetical protein LSA_05200 [Fructilactobacillus sanfranciscensis TMW 1.1304]|uniref:Uncharacterized protein n=1 Tax=Fructilactobacillus sanfranciscensis (strain TMW 1.1304) TaxID=714313 RepID=G2KVE6_FRUST|nr:hypothetical protein LSA_05200 [Fructilactobacillus sanfranciscensis TMW 1.1304]
MEFTKKGIITLSFESLLLIIAAISESTIPFLIGKLIAVIF